VLDRSRPVGRDLQDGSRLLKGLKPLGAYLPSCTAQQCLRALKGSSTVWAAAVRVLLGLKACSTLDGCGTSLRHDTRDLSCR